jgi:hypothetical protein
MQLKELSVAENDYKSDTLAAEAVSITGNEKLRIEITETGGLIVSLYNFPQWSRNKPVRTQRIAFHGLDLEELEEFIQNAKQFISEAEMVRTIKGN